MSFPQRIVCMTEESVETLYLLGKQDLIVGVSSFVKRPEQAQKLPKVSGFTNANIKKIDDLKPDLILGFSDIQQDIAKDLIALGHNVFITNQRSIAEILDYILMLGRLVSEEAKAIALVQTYRKKIKNIKKLENAPKIYLEEWDEPMISGIRWFSELFELFGATDIFSKESKGSLAKERFIKANDVIEKNPDYIFACWCGKKVNIESIKTRTGFEKITAVKNNNIIELEPEIFLQPGPALFESGIDVIQELLSGSTT